MHDSIHALLAAAAFAADRHRDQRRKDSAASPYINHPLAVAALLSRSGITDVDVLAAAILHDTIEDTDTVVQELRERFGDRVAGIVLEVTDDKSLPKQTRKQLQIVHTPHKSVEAKLIKLADKISNIRDLSAKSPVGWDVIRKRQYLDWAVQVINGCRGVNQQLEELFDHEVSLAKARISADAADLESKGI